MKHMAAAEAKNHFGHLLDLAQRSPVTIEKKGRAVAIVVSCDDYQHMERLEDENWALKAELAKRKGYLSPEKSKKILDDL